MVSTFLSDEARRFCQTTSVRGIPRIINSKSRVHSVIWLLGVLTCTSVLVWQVVVIFTRYRSYPVNSVFNQSPEWDNTTFPDITVCNLCSLVYEIEMPIDYIDYLSTFIKQFEPNDFLNHMLKADPNITYTEDDYQRVLEILGSPATYFLNFHIQGKSSNMPIIDCSYFNWDYNKEYNYNCFDSIQESWDSDYYKCYTLRLNDTLRKNTRGFSAIVYVEDALENVMLSYSLDLRRTRGKGMKVLIHEPGTKPNMKLGVGIETGKSTTLTLQQTKISRLPEPYSNCTSQRTLDSVGESPSYTQAFCNDVCLQEQYLQQCGCLFNVYQFTDSQQQRANNSICGDIGITNVNSSINWNGVDQISCTQRISENKNVCHNECPLPCEEFHYNSRIAANSWPHATSQLSFYLTYIDGNPRFGNKFSEYLTDYMYVSYNNTASLQILEKLDKEGLIQANFLELNIQFDSNAYQRETEVAAFPMDAFGAQLGGILSLWLGLTIMVIFEVGEFIINLLSAILSVRRNQPAKECSKS